MFSLPTGKRLEIDEAIAKGYPGHSGGSYGYTMRVLEFIAKEGWDAYAKIMLKKYGSPPSKKEETPEEKRKRFLALPHDMSLDEQCKAVAEFKDVPMTYSEMRERFG